MSPSIMVEELMSKRQSFNDFIYLPLFDALAELERRQTDLSLSTYVEKYLSKDIPDIMKEKKSAVLFRHIATPNYEIRRFMNIADTVDDYGIQPLILEYLDDKFTNRNQWKYFLGRLSFYKGHDKNKTAMFECKVIMDFNTHNMQPISSVKTLAGNSLVDFHHDLFLRHFPHMKNVGMFDMSEWLREHGGGAKAYYKTFLSLFLKHGILFENFLIDGNESVFTKEIILPALFEIHKETRVKPLIVALEPTDIESDQFWLSHPYEKTDATQL